MSRAVRSLAAVLPLVALLALPAVAQESPDPAFSQRWPAAPSTAAPRTGLQLVDNGLPNYLITGYWPPTNEMLRPWNTDPNQRPPGQPWVGENWEGRGFNIYALFPEFPGGTTVNPKGNGDFEVDYQDTSNDWWGYLPQVRPLVITTFSRANTNVGWEMEGGNIFYALSAWSPDYLAPTRPDASLPADPPNTQRWSTLPMQAIVDAVAAQVPGVDPFISPIDTGNFLSNYIGYHGNWWRDLHAAPGDPMRCIIAGHIHVGRLTPVATGTDATVVTLREVIRHANSLMGPRGDLDCDGDVDFDDIDPFVAALGGAVAYYAQFPDCHYGLADIDDDGLVTFDDIDPFVSLLGGQ